VDRGTDLLILHEINSTLSEKVTYKMKSTFNSTTERAFDTLAKKWKVHVGPHHRPTSVRKSFIDPYTTGSTPSNVSAPSI